MFEWWAGVLIQKVLDSDRPPYSLAKIGPIYKNTAQKVFAAAMFSAEA